VIERRSQIAEFRIHGCDNAGAGVHGSISSRMSARGEARA
jgi:hypothetical protein